MSDHDEHGGGRTAPATTAASRPRRTITGSARTATRAIRAGPDRRGRAGHGTAELHRGACRRARADGRARGASRRARGGRRRTRGPAGRRARTEEVGVMTATMTPIEEIAAAAVDLRRARLAAVPAAPDRRRRAAAASGADCTTPASIPSRRAGSARSPARRPSPRCGGRARASSAGSGSRSARAPTIWVLDIDPRARRRRVARPARGRARRAPGHLGGRDRRRRPAPLLGLAGRRRRGAPQQHGKIAPGLDVKAAGGYVVAPPSLHVERQALCWTARPGDRPGARAGLARRARARGEPDGRRRPRARAAARSSCCAPATGTTRRSVLAGLMRWMGRRRGRDRRGRARVLPHPMRPRRPDPRSTSRKRSARCATSRAATGRRSGIMTEADKSNLRALDTIKMLETTAPLVQWIIGGIAAAGHLSCSRAGRRSESRS